MVVSQAVSQNNGGFRNQIFGIFGESCCLVYPFRIDEHLSLSSLIRNPLLYTTTMSYPSLFFPKIFISFPLYPEHQSLTHLET